MHYGACLIGTRSNQWVSTAVRAEQLGFDSVWIPEHLVFPVDITSTYPGELGTPGGDAPAQMKPPPNMPVFEPTAALCAIADATSTIKLGTNVYLPGLRHPFVVARAFLTLDHFSGGRAICGVGVGWLREEYTAAGLDPRTRGARLDEVLEVCRRLWTEAVIEHHGRCWDFEPVMFEPKPISQPRLPIHVGGESAAAFRRIARHGDGWLAYQHSPESIKEPLEDLAKALAEEGRDLSSVEVSIVGQPASRDEAAELAAAGVDRVILFPRRRSADGGPVSVLEEFAAVVM